MYKRDAFNMHQPPSPPPPSLGVRACACQDMSFFCLTISLFLAVIRKGTFAKYDYGILKNLKEYGQLKPPKFDLSHIPKSLPLWMGYGGNDALADLTDVEHTLKELESKPELLYIEDYGHIDFLLSVKAKEDVYDNMVEFFNSFGKFNSV